METTFLFYDIETTGLNRAFDQVLQFAAIRTDRRLNEIGRHNIKVKLRPDVVPSPAAILTNHISISAFSSGLCEYEAMVEIHRLMNRQGTISIGYNNLGFDDEFLRFAFHRNLLPPYTHQFKSGCGRMDLYPMAIIYWLYKREALIWPQIDGKPSLKLEHLGAANHLAAGQAHDALVDVETTLELARRFIKQKKTWDYLEGYFDKETDRHRTEELPVVFESAAGSHRKALMVAGEYGPARNYQVPVISIGNSLAYPNQSLWLRLDLPQLQQTSAENIAETTWVIRKRFGEPGILLPPHKRYWHGLGDERRALGAENIQWLKQNPELFQHIINYYRQFSYPFIPELDPDASLYQIGFYSRDDETTCRAFHRASPGKKAKLIDQFSSPEARALARRVLCRNYPSQVPDSFLQEFNQYLQQVNPSKAEDAIIDYRQNRRTTPVQALIEIKELKQNGELSADGRRLLDDLETYILSRFAQKTR